MSIRAAIATLRYLDGTKSFSSISYWSNIIACGSSVAAASSGQPMFMTATIAGVVVSTGAQVASSIGFDFTAETLREFIESRAQGSIDQPNLALPRPQSSSTSDLA